MRIGRSKIEKHEYTLKTDLKPMDETIAEKDVGVTIDNKLSFDIHITEKVNKANSIVGVIRRTFEYLDLKIHCIQNSICQFSKTSSRICHEPSLEPISQQKTHRHD